MSIQFFISLSFFLWHNIILIHIVLIETLIIFAQIIHYSALTKKKPTKIYSWSWITFGRRFMLMKNFSEKISQLIRVCSTNNHPKYNMKKKQQQITKKKVINHYSWFLIIFDANFYLEHINHENVIIVSLTNLPRHPKLFYKWQMESKTLLIYKTY